MADDLKNSSENVSEDISPTKEDLLKTLDFEINQISSEQQRNGWTKWALYGVLAGSLWLLAEQWEKGDFNFTVVLILIVVFSIGLDILRQSKRLLPHQPGKYKRALRFKPITELGVNSPAFFLYAIRHVLVFGIAAIFAGKVFWISAIIVLWYYGGYTLTSLLVFILGYFVWYFPSTETIYKRTSKLSLKRYYRYWGLTLIGLIWGFIGYLNAALAYSPEGIKVVNFRIAGLLVVIGYAFYLLLELSVKIPLLSNLVEIRRDLSFGRIEIQAATRQAEIIIAGILVDERLQADIAELMPLVEQRRLGFTQLYDKITRLSKVIPDQHATITEEHIKMAKEILAPCLDGIAKILEKSEEEERLERKLRMDTSAVADESPESVKSAEEFLKKIEDLDSEMIGKGEVLLNDLQPLLERIKGKKIIDE